MSDLSLLAINLTERCNLSCAHCYLDAKTRYDGTNGELTTGEVCTLLDDIATRSDETMIVLTGGEPLLRKDIEIMVRHGTDLGLAMVLGTNGMALTPARVISLKAAGLLGVGISVDSLRPERHDRFRGLEGSWQKTMDGIENCRKQSLAFQIHFSVNQGNVYELDNVVAFCREKSAKVLNIFFLVCTGRGESVTDITPEQYEQTLTWLVKAQKLYDDLIIRARCAPHFKRIAHQLDPDIPLTSISGFDGDGCIAGTRYCRIKPDGGLTACPYIEESLGSIKEQPFWDIWESHPTMQSLREPKLNGKCGACEYQNLCGGCRARAIAKGGDLMDADPWCTYRPQGNDIIVPYIAASKITWSPEAQKVLARVPGFVRKMVKGRAEAHVEGQGENLVTPEHMKNLATRRFGNKV